MFKKRISILFAVVILVGILSTIPFTMSVHAAISSPASTPKITHSGQVVDSITYRGATINAVYTPYRDGLATDWTYGCFVLPRTFYSTIYGITVSKLDSATSIPKASSGYFQETRSPRKGDIVRCNDYVHWALVKEVNGTTVTIIQQNAYWNNYTCAQVGNTVSSSDNSVSFFTYSGYLPDDGGNLKVNVSGSQAYFNWDWDGNATYYNVKLWRNKVWEGDPYRIVWSVKSNNYAFALPKGTYQAYVDACNDNTGYCKMSNVITFTIGDVGINLNVAIYGGQVSFNWNSDNSPSYSLKVFKEFTWDGELYENVQPLTKTSYILGLPKGRYQAYVDGKSMSNVVDFSIGEETPILKANVRRNQVYFNWDKDSKAKSYNLKIYKGHIWQVDAYEIINSIAESEAAVALPSGTYQAYVDAVGDNYLHMGSVVEFKVGNSEPVLSAKIIGNQVVFSWTKNNNAKTYQLKIWKGHAWRGDAFFVKKDIFSTQETVLLPKGEYQAYIDAIEDNNIVMGNVIDVSITADNYVEPTEPPTIQPTEPSKLILGDVDGDDEVTIIDATCIQRKLASIPTAKYIEAAADTDEDDEITIVDATTIQRWLAQLPSNDKIGKPIS